MEYESGCDNCGWFADCDAAGDKKAGAKTMRLAAKHVADTGHSVYFNRIAWFNIQPEKL